MTLSLREGHPGDDSTVTRSDLHTQHRRKKLNKNSVNTQLSSVIEYNIGEEDGASFRTPASVSSSAWRTADTVASLVRVMCYANSMRRQ